jgi:hypothetical protein
VVAGAPSAHADGLTFTPRSAFSITNTEYASCVDANVNQMHSNGGDVQIYRCHGRENQVWSVRPSGQYFTITLQGYPDRCLEVETGTLPNNNTPVQLWTCNGSDQQKWIISRVALVNKFQEMSAGFINRAFRIRNLAGNKALTAAGLSDTDDFVLGVVEATAVYDGGGGIIVDVPKEFRRANIAMHRLVDGAPPPNTVWESPVLTCAVYGTDASRITGNFGSATCPGLPTATG